MKDTLIVLGILLVAGAQIVALIAGIRIRGRVGVLRAEGFLPSALHRPVANQAFDDAALTLTDYRHVGDDRVKAWNRTKDIARWVGAAGLLLAVGALLAPIIQSRS